jgi:hypothetical protein
MLEEWLYESIISSALPYNVDSFSFGLSVHRGRYRNPALFRLTIQVTAAPRAGARRRVVEDIDGLADEFEEEFDEEADEELRNEDDEDDAEGMYSQRRVRDHHDGLEPEDGQEDQDEEIERDVGAGSGYACAVEESSSAPKVRARRFSAAKTFIRGAASPGKGLRMGARFKVRQGQYSRATGSVQCEVFMVESRQVALIRGALVARSPRRTRTLNTVTHHF